MSLALALNNAITGLRVNQQSISVLSHNIANVNTEGYSRQIISQSAVYVEGSGSGVKIDEIGRKIDKYLQRSLQTQGATVGMLQATSDFYQRFQNFLGQPGASNSLDAFLTNFFNSIQQLAETPEVNSLKANAVAAGAAIAKQISDLAASAEDLRYQADQEIADAVNIINGSLDRLYNLNVALAKAGTLGQPLTGLLDERDKELRTLSDNLNISISYGEYGKVNIVGGDGVLILEDGTKHPLRYNKASAVSTFVNNGTLSALEVLSLDLSGNEVGASLPLITAGTSSEVVSKVSSGKIAGLQQMRDVEFPAILDQLDELASRLRDEFNKIHNNGSGFPPASSLTGERLVQPSDQYDWSGQVLIGVTQTDGKPVPSSYSDETYTGIRALTLDLSTLNSGQGNGKPTLQTIIDEINNHFSAPANRVTLGNANNIQLVSDSTSVPPPAGIFSFDLDVENISNNTSRIFVTDTTVLDDTATDITSITQAAPSIGILTSASYTTTFGSADVTINLASAPDVVVGDIIYLDPPSGAVNGITVPQLTGFFTVTAVTGSSLTFTSAGVAAATGSVADAGNIQMYPPYNSVTSGQKLRSRDNGIMQVDLSASPASLYYDITLDVTVIGEDDVQYSAQVTYRVTNNQQGLYNKRYNATAVTAPATLITPSNSQESLRAILVDENGNELPTVNGKYIDGQSYLKLVAGNAGATYAVSINELDSKQLGKPDATPAEAGTNLSFSHYFGLNNFFKSNALTATGDTLRNSAYNLAVQDHLIVNPNLISTGKLIQQTASTASNNLDVYTYARYAGDNSIAQQLALLNTQVLSFDAAGGLPAVQLSLQAYAGQVIGSVAQKSSAANDNTANAEFIFNGFKSKQQAISGVNLDEELANTILFQNAYSATARVVTVVNKMYEDLIASF